ncbi:hybrid sensor histidine kinase/response regulator [Aurantimonas endophytica]|uniref:histidine kinase n=1 Tax=Aurantimonas endophytica TaxID=1522175 RepID=A0A7W6HHS5_9HYPH|nr:ATP-binding protein [Aurantimonas endophytica]MBB4005187.1 signal transduction histidine kinase/CheY-like chemotaxis protein/purine-cytosine permease-like protein [Aurantimonas endophytica]MCO6406150.1 response regulator [Aurantimonas endophytica]
MTAPQRILRVRRSYNQWVADETLEDYALRFTAKRGRRWSPWQLAMTACGGISFLALEAIGGTVTLHYGFDNALPAILVVALLIFGAGLPISFYAAKYGVDIDLLTRGAGFGYLGSTVTSLIYACFTFIFFAIEAAIMAMALEMMLGLPLWAGYVVCAVAVIPIVTHGITLISRFQMWTQPAWIILNLAPFVFLAAQGALPLEEWQAYEGVRSPAGGGFDVLLFGSATAILFALTAQIGEQVDFLRFMPRRTRETQLGWWSALIAGGPGWILIGAVKILAGSLLAVLVVSQGLPAETAQHPTEMYRVAFGHVFSQEALVIAATGIFVVIAQMKINVTNAYAGSIAWSNFFSRLTHSHPGRVVWLVFNVAIALMLMEMGILRALEEILGLYAILAVSWVAALVADLVVNKPLGLSPRHIEFKRAHLYDINPVGFGAMGAGILVASLCHTGLFGETMSALAAFAAIGTAFVASPLIALATGGRYYIARRPREDWAGLPTIACCICEHHFEAEDMASCPAYSGPICSLCCSLDARCHDLCKTDSRVREQVVGALRRNVSERLAGFADSPRGHYLAIFVTMLAVTGSILALIGFQASLDQPHNQATITAILVRVFAVFVIVAGVASWLFVLAHASRRVAQEESSRQTLLLTQEIDAHRRTDAELQLAKEKAEAASLAKTRFLVGMSHELRTPLNSILGFAQILEQDPALPGKRRGAVKVIRRSGEHLAGLIDGLLDISRIEAGKLQVYRDQIALGPLLGEIVEMFRLQADGAGIGFAFEVERTLPDFVRGDEKRLRQILINLLSNAIKFTHEGSVTLRVSYRSQVAEFRVVDTGPGMAAKDLTRIFEPFERLEGGASAVPGTGLGLTITKLLTEILGGDIRVTSTPGQGSIFAVRLFLPSVSAMPIAVSRERRIVGYAGRRMTVLAVDDEPAHRQLLEEILSPLGFTVLTVEGGAACLKLVPLAEPDLLIVDITMPGMNGWELATRLRESGVDTPIAMLSADARPASPDMRLCDDWIGKPLAVPMLLESVRRLLGVAWLYDDAPVGASVPGEVELEAFEIPDRGDLRDLVSLLQIGFVRGIHAKLDDLASRQPRTQRFVARIRSRVDRFDLDACLGFIEGLDDAL